MNKIESFCQKTNITIEQFYGKELITEYLDLRSVTSIPEGFNPTVGGGLYLRSVTSIPEGFNPTVGGYLDLSSVTSIPEGFNPTVGGYLDLRSVTSIPEGFNPTVGGGLYLRSVTSIPEGFNPTVGGDLDLRSVSRYIGAQIPKIVLEWQDGKYKKVDGIFCEFLNKNPRIVNGIEVFQLKKVNKKEFLFLAKQDSYYAHGSTLEKSIEDLKFKIMSDKLKKEPLKMDTVITRQYYRIITGACELGVDSWMKQNEVTNEEITVRELLPILEKTNAYGLSNFKKLIQ